MSWLIPKEIENNINEIITKGEELILPVKILIIILILIALLVFAGLAVNLIGEWFF